MSPVLNQLLKDAGHEITHDWTITDDIGDKDMVWEESGRRAALDITGVVNCDAYVLISDNEKQGKGMYVELGAALSLHEKFGKPSIYIVGPLNHSSVFYYHPAVTLLESDKDFLRELH